MTGSIDDHMPGESLNVEDESVAHVYIQSKNPGELVTQAGVMVVVF